MTEGRRVHITGIVQGVGFRPFVYGLATRLGLLGWVRNSSAGVDIEVDGAPSALALFEEALHHQAPPLAQIDSVEVEVMPPQGFTLFEIVHSAAREGEFIPISPDVSTCADCLQELFDPDDRRYRYPFINCTNCGPRFTIIKDIPYDRPKTTMAGFELCETCAAEYHDPGDRRFHAQPVACPECGPHVWLERGQRKLENGGQPDGDMFFAAEAALQEARQLLQDGQILAIKGLGGFHLACDATNEQAVAELRRRKLRVDKPFALMMPDIETVERFCFVSEAERALLESRERPIVILQQRPEAAIAPSTAPGQATLGVMLPYTPLHSLLLEPADGFPEALVMTSGNLSEEPIAYRNDEARERLAKLADAFLLNNRDIFVRTDDSVVRSREWERGSVGEWVPDDLPPAPSLPSPYFLRRARGYAPNPIRLPWEAPPLLATGAELKNTFCLTRDRYAFLSHHIGDLENYETLQSFEEGIKRFQRLFRIQPEAIVYDLHPDYLATRYALERAEEERLPAVGVQHHHAHIAACMVDQGLDSAERVIGVSFDGTGYGEDGAIWGGEFLIAGYAVYERPLHLAYVPLPGGDRAVKEPWRVALAWLHQTGIPWAGMLAPVRYGAQAASGIDALDVLHHQITSGVNAPPTSSMGRLFDAVSALVGVRQQVNYEAQGAIELEALVDPLENGAYPFALGGGVVDPAPLFAALVEDSRRHTDAGVMAARFHNGVAQMVLDVCCRLRQDTGLEKVALSGGVWQNMALLARTVPLLRNEGFTLLLHRQVPANDGGLALGQVAVGRARLESVI